MRNYLLVILILPFLTAGSASSASANPGKLMYQNDLLAEYEQRFILIEKQFAEYKKQLDPKKMTTLDGKMKVGNFENSRNSLKAKLRDLRKAAAPLSETDRGDLNKRFDSLTAEFEELKKSTE